MIANNVVGYRKLIVFQKSKQLVLLIYRLTENFPKNETYGITSQLRRAAVSIMLNIAEGHSRKSKKEFCHFIDIALGSCTETEVLIELTFELKYLNEEQHKQLEELRSEVGRLLFSFRRSLTA